MVILGIDEVGRGPLAGPLVVGAVILPKNRPAWVSELKDSKKLSFKKRASLDKIIRRDCPAVGVGWVDVGELDEIGISEALRLATRRAVKIVQKMPGAAFSQIVIDGKVNFLQGTKLEKFVSVMPKADDLVKEVSAASIVAKVARDNYMIDLAKKYPEYFFDTNMGYGTAKHLQAIREHGVCSEHRKSFEPIKTMKGWGFDGVVKNTTSIGRCGEEKVAGYLTEMGHEIVSCNYRTKVYEIDIVSVFGDKIYFTEVKTRKNNVRGSGLDCVTSRKLARMRFAVEGFLKERPEYGDFNPVLAAAAVEGENVEEWVIIR